MFDESEQRKIVNMRKKPSPSERPDRQKDRMLWHRYGIRLSDFNIMLAKQDERCAICREMFDAMPSVDHDHNSGKIRGLLCRYCNVLVGYLEKRPKLVKPAMKYVLAKGKE